MALTVTKVKESVAGDVRVAYGKITFDNSYPTGGEPIAASDFKWKKLFGILLEGQTSVVTKTASFDAANSKLVVVAESAGVAAEAANSSDQSLVSVNYIALGF